MEHLSKDIKYEGDPFSTIVQAMRNVGRNETSTLTMGTILAPPPNLLLKIDNDPILYDKKDIYVAEWLTRHERVVTITHKEMELRDLGDKKENDYLDTDDKAFPFTHYKHNYVVLKFEDLLKKDDRVIVECDDEKMAYTILDRVVKYK